jgi:hypothetical protein
MSQPDTGDTAPRAYRGLVLLFYLCFFLLSSSGRLGSSDAGAQLQAAVLLATTGRLGASSPPANERNGGVWRRGINGRYYEVHDIGNVVLMLPAAWAGQRLSPAPSGDDFDAPSLLCRVGVSMTYAVVSALGCFFMFRLFALQRGNRVAFLLSLLLPATTIFWAYSKTAWDVMGACCAMCAALYAAAVVLRGGTRTRDLVRLAIYMAIVSSFRNSLAPFLMLGTASLLYAARRDLAWRGYAACAGTWFVGLLPSLVYNAVRSGSPLRPANASAEYLQTQGLGGDVVHGLWGLLLSPNHGLFVFSPILLLLLALPLAWPRLAANERHLLVAMAACALPYTLLIASTRVWHGVFGWGPRYLLPVVPIAFYGTALTLTAMWEKWRAPLLGLIVVSGLLSAPPALVNWSSAIIAFPQALDHDAPWPYQLDAVWQELVRGLQGKPFPIPAALAADPERRAGAGFPDLSIVRLMERSRGELAAGSAIFLTLGLMAAFTMRTLLSPENDGELLRRETR